MEPIEYLRILRLRWKVIVAVAALGFFAGWWTAPSAEDRDPVNAYQATHTLVVDPNVQAASSFGNKTLDQLALLATVGEVPTMAADALDWRGDPAVLATEVTAVANSQLQTITVSSTQQDPERAVLVANTFAEALVSYLEGEAQERYQRSVDLTTERMDELREEIRSLDLDISRQSDGDNDILIAQRDALVRQFGLAYEQYQQLAADGVPPGGLLTLQRATAIPVAQGGFQAPDSRIARALLAGILGLLLGVAAALVLARLDVKIRTKEEAESAFGVPVLVEVPHRSRGKHTKRGDLVTMSHPLSTGAEIHRVLRTALSYTAMASANGNGHAASAGARDHPHTILVTSSVPGEGKTTTAANLAAAYAEVGRSVLVIEADFRRPTIHEFFDVEIGPGISDLLAARRRGHPITTEALSRLTVRTSVPGVRLLPSGTPGAEILVAVGLEKEVVAAAAPLADVLIIDTSPMLVANDTAEVVPAVDALVVVCRSGAVSRDAADRVAERLRRLKAPIAGVVLVAPPRTAATHKGYEYYAYGHRDRSTWRRAVRRLAAPKERKYERERHADQQRSPSAAASSARTGGHLGPEQR